MSIWDTIRQVKATKGGNYIQPGTYIVRIQGVRFGKRRQGDEMVAIEMRCLKVLAKVSDADGNSVSNLENEEFAHILINGGKQKDMFLPNFKAFIMGGMNAVEDDVGPDECEAVTSDMQPMAGNIVRVQAVSAETKAGGDFTRVAYMGWLTKAEAKAAGIDVDSLKGAQFADQV